MTRCDGARNKCVCNILPLANDLTTKLPLSTKWHWLPFPTFILDRHCMMMSAVKLWDQRKRKGSNIGCTTCLTRAGTGTKLMCAVYNLYVLLYSPAWGSIHHIWKHVQTSNVIIFHFCSPTLICSTQCLSHYCLSPPATVWDINNKNWTPKIPFSQKWDTFES